MKRYAVSHINWFDHDLTTVIVEADSVREALLQHPEIAAMEAPDGSIPEDLDEAKEWAFDQDAMIHAEEIPQ